MVFQSKDELIQAENAKRKDRLREILRIENLDDGKNKKITEFTKCQN